MESVMPINKAVLLDGAIDYIRKNAVVVKSKKGSEYLTIPNYSEATVGDTTGQVRFAFMALRPAAEGHVRATQSVEVNFAKLSPEERAAMLEKLAAIE
jgi:hypothetical protein